MTDRDKRISDQLVRLVQIVFGLVLAQSLLLHRDVVIHPFAHLVAAFALVTVYVTTILSWIDWHVTMEARPYNFNPKSQHRTTEYLRLGFDVLVVMIYAYMLFTIEEFKNTPALGIGRYLLGFPATFGAYLLSGLARRRAHGRLATNLWPILLFGIAYAGLSVAYSPFRFGWFAAPPAAQWVDTVAIGVAFCFMLAYRLVRSRIVKRRREWKDAGLVVGIDIDGVLANQIHGIIPRVRARLGIDLSYERVTDWRLPLGVSDIAKEIEIALGDQDYVLGMPVHPGGRDVVDELYMRNRVIMVTARPPETRQWTQQWLQNHGFTFDDLVNVKEQGKSLYRSDVLIDDYIGNLREYLENTRGRAILVDQPWNRSGRGDLQKWIDEGRLSVVNAVGEVGAIMKRLRDLRGK